MRLDIFTEVILSLNNPREISRVQFWSVSRREFDGDLRMWINERNERDYTAKYLTVDNLITGQKEDVAITHEGNDWDCLYWQRNQIYRPNEPESETYVRFNGSTYGRLRLGGLLNKNTLSLETSGIFSEYIAQKYIRISDEA
jgi:hypothetical protein